MERWRSRLSPSSFQTYISFLNAFCSSIGKDKEEFLSWARGSDDKYEVLDKLQQFVDNLHGRRFRTRQTAYAALRSFLIHNRVQLPQDPSYHIRADTAPVERRLTLEHLHQLIGLATQPMRSMLLVKWMGLMDTECLLQFSHNYAEPVVKALRNKDPILQVKLPGRKRSRNLRPFYTFIGKDALTSLEEYFDRIRGCPRKGEPIWMYQYRRTRTRPVTKNGFEMSWLRLLRRSGLVPSEPGERYTVRYGFNVHNTRDLAISVLNTVSGLNPKCIEFWAGHDIDPLGYNQFYSVKPQWVQEQYKLAEPYLNILTGNQGESKETQAELQRLREELEELKLAVRMNPQAWIHLPIDP